MMSNKPSSTPEVDDECVIAKSMFNDLFSCLLWVWPADGDWLWFVILGAMSATIGYALSQAYRLAAASIIARAAARA